VGYSSRAFLADPHRPYARNLERISLTTFVPLGYRLNFRPNATFEQPVARRAERALCNVCGFEQVMITRATRVPGALALATGAHVPRAQVESRFSGLPTCLRLDPANLP